MKNATMVLLLAAAAPFAAARSPEKITVDAAAPVVTRDELMIDAPIDLVWKTLTNIAAWPKWRPTVSSAHLEGSLKVGAVFRWEQGDLQITSTVRELARPRRIAWTGTAPGIEAVHVWELTPVAGKVLVHTEESWNGEAVREQAARLQPLLDDAIHDWLTRLKRKCEEAKAPLIPKSEM